MCDANNLRAKNVLALQLCVQGDKFTSRRPISVNYDLFVL